MVCIDFQGGAHGNYLEFICNKFLACVPTAGLTPFNHLGASHQQNYLGSQIFQGGHYSFRPEITHVLEENQVVSIQIDIDDLLPLTSVSLLRAGNYNYDNDELELDTYNKLNNRDYKWVLDNIVINFFSNQIQSSYNAVKDAAWPCANNLYEFNQLPTWIQDECINIHGLVLMQLDKENPNCPRHVLREFFKLGFKYPLQSGFIQQQKKMVYPSSISVYSMPFSAFYNVESFVTHLHAVAEMTGYTVHNLPDLLVVHQQFLDLQIYKTSKLRCDRLISDIQLGQSFILPKLTLLEESYVSAQLELCYNKELPRWFNKSQDILNYLSI